MAYVMMPHSPLIWSPAYTGNPSWMWTCICGKHDTAETQGEAGEKARAHMRSGK